MYYKLPSIARDELQILYMNKMLEPVSLRVIASEIKENTERGDMFLKLLGYEDD